jgi:hypothetical protein
MYSVLDALKDEANDAGCDPTTLRIEHINRYTVSAYACNRSTGIEEITSGRIRHQGDIYAEITYIERRPVFY